MEQVAWNIAKPIFSVILVVLGVVCAVKAFQAFKQNDEAMLWKNLIVFFICFGIVYKIEDVFQLMQDVWDEIRIKKG
jgi:hypothetical protein